ncbi:YceD family protein [Caldovatus aquaticus]|uniref:DUF177 domain-containing protein n=1 Tax=Caldovatus aquaticus TaxID=2865671 RepID=A0ABS7EZ70_9PROT|nr:YceD family protein [Caldovatus aquaticus]MBW8268589.1 DUF177 domain-containing protein [Caldovatus aquaticus]
MPLRPEFSRPVRADRISAEGRTERLVASPAERAALARRFGIEAVERLEAEVTLRPAPGGQIAARGRLVATVVQECVVSFAPVTQRVEERVDLRFVPAEAAEALGEEEPEAPDVVPMEPGGVLDLGEALAQQLALALDPYPRAEGATLPPDLRAPGDGPEAVPPAAGARPFAALARLRPKRDEE